MVHNMMFNTTTNLKVPHKETLKRSEWWDNGVLPLWITAQNQVGHGSAYLKIRYLGRRGHASLLLRVCDPN